MYLAFKGHRHHVRQPAHLQAHHQSSAGSKAERKAFVPLLVLVSAFREFSPGDANCGFASDEEHAEYEQGVIRQGLPWPLDELSLSFEQLPRSSERLLWSSEQRLM